VLLSEPDAEIALHCDHRHHKDFQLFSKKEPEHSPLFDVNHLKCNLKLRAFSVLASVAIIFYARLDPAVCRSYRFIRRVSTSV